MAKLYYYYSSMNAGKTTALLQSAYNYHERGMRTLILKPDLDNRDTKDPLIVSRIGLQAPCTLISPYSNLLALVTQEVAHAPVHCVLVDESQFLRKEQIEQLCQVVDDLDIPVLCYGLRTDFQGELFTGSKALLAWADNLVELKTICHCGAKATMLVRIDPDGNVVTDGNQIEIGGNERYVSVCRKHFRAGIYKT